jgi:hypothetical protein|tara:strand:- start:105 stop:473 length:369 start_codon:yes stop_codon:yes gene_type:complete
MAKKQKSFADKAAGSADKDAVYVKYVNSVRSKKTGHWRFNEQMVKTKKGESLDVALKRLDEAANLSDIDLTKFVKVDSDKNKSGDKKKPKDLEVKVAEGEKPAKNESKKNNPRKEDSVKNNK